jgi:hypothetical protein
MYTFKVRYYSQEVFIVSFSVIVWVSGLNFEIGHYSILPNSHLLMVIFQSDLSIYNICSLKREGVIIIIIIIITEK